MTELERNITASQEKRIKAGTLTGSHIIIRQNGRYILNKTFGCSSARGEKLKNDATYRIASMTKPVTAAAMLIEQQKGRLSIFDDVSDYLDGFDELTVVKEDGTIEKAKNRIKIYMLVSHISGINSSAIEGVNNPMPFESRNLKTVTEYAAGVPLKFEPGTAQEYNTAAFDVCARIIEKTSGMDFSEYLKTNLFDKLGMKDTSFSPTEEQWKRMVSIHDMKDGRAVDFPSSCSSVIDGYPVTYYAAGCALMSTAEDYSRFAEMLLNSGLSDDGTAVLTEDSVKLMSSPVVKDDIMPGSQKWGLGVRVITDDNYVLPKGSFGWSGMYGTHFWVDPANNLTAVYMKNSKYDGGAGCQTANELETDVMKSLNSAKEML